ncbi:MAG TPA: hypothetical protein VFC53_06895 [Dehalococcoidia bacterium]|jgi:hypothetical protein|nr:hypothetical protein [Dehalococcoidia bacterium]
MTRLALGEDVRRQLRDRVRFLPKHGSAYVRAQRLRSLLEELGIRCDERIDLQDADAVLLASAHGTEAIIAARLSDEERHTAYTRVVARLLVSDMRAPIDARIEGQHGIRLSTREREEDRLVEGLALALASGRLEAAPRPLYDDVPKLTFAFTPRSAARSTLGGLHRWSVLWYKRSDFYRRLRARRRVSEAIGRICVALDPNPPLVA